MTVKGFFKSNVFKCIATLLCVLLVCGVFLTIMNGLLAVSDQERLDRAIIKIYGKSVSYKVDNDLANYNDNANIDAAYIMADGNYLVKSTGKFGFDNGTVTCWVVVNVAGNSVRGIDKVVIDSNKGQSYIDRVGESALNQFSELYEDGIVYSADLITNATVTKTKTAICNAVNGALDFVNAKFGNVAQDNYSGLKYTEYIETKQTSHESDKNGNLIFHVITKGYGMATAFTIDITVDRKGVITAYKIIKNGTDNYDPNKMNAGILDGTLFVGKTITDIIKLADEGMEYEGIGSSIKTGATNSNYLCLYAAAFAAENYEQFLTELPEAPEEPELPEGGDEDNDEENGGEGNE